jgi:adenylate cyclase, class 2
MKNTGQEIEVKFYVQDLPALEKRLLALGAQLTQPRQHEVNLRYDTPDRQLSKASQTLRLRRDQLSRLTYKGAGGEQGGARLRQELEVEVSDFDTARAILEALGYRVFVMYEKYRTTYTLGPVEVTLDELPYGNFSEIEGPDGAAIQSAARQLSLDWDARSLDSYLKLFERARQELSFSFRDLSFENFLGLGVLPSHLGLHPADSPELPGTD